MTDRLRVWLSRRWPEAVEQALAFDYELRCNDSDQPMTNAQLLEALQWADALCPTVTDRLDAALFEQVEQQAVRTRILGNFGVGYNHIDRTASQSLGLTVTNTPDVLTEACAELAMTLLLMVARRAGEGERSLRAGQWQGWRPTHMMGTEVTGATLGIVGMGRIGRAMARKAQQGFGMTICFTGGDAQDLQAERHGTLETLLPCCDFVSLHCPSTAATKHLLNANRLGLMKPTAFLINTARGEVVDEAALARALAAGDLAGAGLDVYEQEPRVHDGLLERENVVLLPHLGSATTAAREAMGYRVKKNLDSFFAGQRPPDRLW